VVVGQKLNQNIFSLLAKLASPLTCK